MALREYLANELGLVRKYQNGDLLQKSLCKILKML